MDETAISREIGGARVTLPLFKLTQKVIPSVVAM